MRNALITLCGLFAVGSLLLAGPTQAERRSETEKSLLGIRVLQTYRTVLARFGQPTRIYRYGETVLTVPVVDANGNPTGGIRALDSGGNGGFAGSTGFGGGRPGMGGMGAMGGKAGGMQGGMPGGMMPGMSGMPMGMMGSMPGRMSGMPAGMTGSLPGGMMPGSGGMPPGMMGSMPGGMQGRFAGNGGRGMPGASGTGLGAANVPQNGGATFTQSGGFMWVYFYPKQELMYWFLFNTDGRVVAIVEKGRNQGKPTSRGITLGDSVKSIYEQYGWPDSMDQQGDAIALHYNLRSHVQFHIINNKVTEIAVFLTEDQHAIESDTVGGVGRPGGMGFPGMAGGGMRRGGGGLPSLAGGGAGPGVGGGGKGEGGAD